MHITQRTYLNSNGSKITNTFRVWKVHIVIIIIILIVFYQQCNQRLNCKKKYIIINNFQAHFAATQQRDSQKDGWKEFDKNPSIFQGLLSYTLLWLGPIQEACFLPKEIKARINNKHPSIIVLDILMELP